MKGRFTIYRGDMGRHKTLFEHTLGYSHTDGTVIQKFEFDEYKLGLFGLVIVECEFSTREEAEAFVLPDWVGHATEVTKDPRYKNQMLARFGSLKLLQQNDSV